MGKCGKFMRRHVIGVHKVVFGNRYIWLFISSKSFFFLQKKFLLSISAIAQQYFIKVFEFWATP
jgi:hypothetical protein